LISVVSVTLICGSVGLPMREEPPLSAARAYRGATAQSDIRVPQLPHPDRATHHGGSARVVSGTAGLRAVRADVCPSAAANRLRRP
jgi:hypothetical protein